MQTQDRRVQRSKRLLAEALITLVLERGYEDVSIRDITAQAQVGYATFFRHYADKEALLHEVLNVVLEDLLGLLRRDGNAADPAADGEVLFRYVAAHHALCSVLLGGRVPSPLVPDIIAAGVQRMLAEHGAIEGNVPPEIVAHHVVSAAITLIRWWLNNDMPYPPAHMGRIYRDLIIAPCYRIGTL